jgi:hypothetical protein
MLFPLFKGETSVSGGRITKKKSPERQIVRHAGGLTSVKVRNRPQAPIHRTTRGEAVQGLQAATEVIDISD